MQGLPLWVAAGLAVAQEQPLMTMDRAAAVVVAQLN
jgi:hypothetical protein